MERVMQNLALASLFTVCLFLFTSLSLMALSHILIVIPGLYYLAKLIQEKKLKIDKSTWSLIGLTTVMILSILLNWSEIEKPVSYLFKLKYFVLGIFSVVVYQMALPAQLNQKKIKVLLYIFLISTTAASISGLVAHWTGYNPLRFRPVSHSSRASGMYGMTITYSYGMALFSAIVLALLSQYRKLRDIPLIITLVISLGVSLTGLYFSFGRGASFGLGLAVPFALLWEKKKWFWSYLAIFLVGLGTFIYLNQTGYFAQWRDRPNSFARTLGEESGRTRISHAQAAFFMAKDNILGVGFRNVEDKVVEYKTKYNLDMPEYKGHAHSNFFEVMGGTGFLGFVLFLLFHLFWAKELINRRDLVGRAGLAFLVAFVGAGLFQSAIIDGESLFFLMNMFAVSKIKLLPTSGPQ